MVKVFLRALELEDLERTHRWHNDPNMYRTLIGTFHYVSRLTEEEWLQKRIAYSPNEVNLAVCLTENKQHIGNIYLRNIDWVNRNSEVHLFLGEVNERSKGCGQAAMRLIADYAFNNLGLWRLFGLVVANNVASIKMLEKCGWTREGLMHQHLFKNGDFQDVVIMAVCANDVEEEKGPDDKIG